MPSFALMHDRLPLHDKELEEMILSAGQIQARVSDMAQEIFRDLQKQGCEQAPVFIAVLQGAAIFHADLIRAYPSHLEVAYVRTRSYEGTLSTGNVQLQLTEDLALDGRDLVIVEDIVDTGQTLQVVARALEARGARSVLTVTMLDKPSARTVNFIPDFVGFTIAPDFVVGYGLDYNGLGRNLPDIYRLKP